MQKIGKSSQSESGSEQQNQEGFVSSKIIIKKQEGPSARTADLQAFPQPQPPQSFQSRYISQGIMRKQPQAMYKRFEWFDYCKEPSPVGKQNSHQFPQPTTTATSPSQYRQISVNMKGETSQQTVTTPKLLTPYDKFIASGHYSLVYSRYRDHSFSNDQQQGENFAKNQILLNCLNQTPQTPISTPTSFIAPIIRQNQPPSPVPMGNSLFLPNSDPNPSYKLIKPFEPPQSTNSTHFFTNKEKLLHFDSRFQCGNLQCAYKHKLQPYTYSLFMHNDTNTNGYNQWFYFSIKNAEKGLKYKLKIVNFRKRHSFFKQGNNPVIFSYKESQLQGKTGYRKQALNLQYTRSDIIKCYPEQEPDRASTPNIASYSPPYYELSFQLQFLHDDDIVFVSMGLPYSYSKLISRLNQLETNVANKNYESDNVNKEQASTSTAQMIFEVESVGRSLSGNAVPLVTLYRQQTRIVQHSIKKQQDCGNKADIEIDIESSKQLSQSPPLTCQQQQLQKQSQYPLKQINPNPIVDNSPILPPHQRPVIFLIARQHPGQTWSSYLMDQLLNDLVTSEDPHILYILNNFVVRAVPMLNVDGVIYGNFRCDLAGMDMNRNWKYPSPVLHPQIVAIKDRLQQWSGFGVESGLVSEVNKNVNLQINIKSKSQNQQQRKLTKKKKTNKKLFAAVEPTVKQKRKKKKKVGGGIKLALDLHGHSKQYNIFCYGVGAKTNVNIDIKQEGRDNDNSFKTQQQQSTPIAHPKLLPFMISQLNEQFHYPFCTFGISKYKQHTARAVMHQISRSPNVFTIQSSFFASRLMKLSESSSIQIPQNQNNQKNQNNQEQDQKPSLSNNKIQQKPKSSLLPPPVSLSFSKKQQTNQQLQQQLKNPNNNKYESSQARQQSGKSITKVFEPIHFQRMAKSILQATCQYFINNNGNNDKKNSLNCGPGHGQVTAIDNTHINNYDFITDEKQSSPFFQTKLNKQKSLAMLLKYQEQRQQRQMALMKEYQQFGKHTKLRSQRHHANAHSHERISSGNQKQLQSLSSPLRHPKGKSSNRSKGRQASPDQQERTASVSAAQSGSDSQPSGDEIELEKKLEKILPNKNLIKECMQLEKTKKKNIADSMSMSINDESGNKSPTTKILKAPILSAKRSSSFKRNGLSLLAEEINRDGKPPINPRKRFVASSPQSKKTPPEQQQQSFIPRTIDVIQQQSQQNGCIKQSRTSGLFQQVKGVSFKSNNININGNKNSQIKSTPKKIKNNLKKILQNTPAVAHHHSAHATSILYEKQQNQGISSLQSKTFQEINQLRNFPPPSHQLSSSSTNKFPHFAHEKIPSKLNHPNYNHQSYQKLVGGYHSLHHVQQQTSSTLELKQDGSGGRSIDNPNRKPHRRRSTASRKLGIVFRDSQQKQSDQQFPILCVLSQNKKRTHFSNNGGKGDGLTAVEEQRVREHSYSITSGNSTVGRIEGDGEGSSERKNALGSIGRWNKNNNISRMLQPIQKDIIIGQKNYNNKSFSSPATGGVLSSNLTHAAQYSTIASSITSKNTPNKTAVQMRTQAIKQLKDKEKNSMELVSKIWRQNFARYGMSGWKGFKN